MFPWERNIFTVCIEIQMHLRMVGYDFFLEDEEKSHCLCDQKSPSSPS